MTKKIDTAAKLVVAVALAALTVATPTAAQMSLYRMDFKPLDFNANNGFLQAGELNIGPQQFAMPGFGWDETHGQAGRPGVYFPNVATGCVTPGVACNPEDPSNRAFLFLFGAVGQTNSTFTSAGVGGSTFPAGGIDPTLPANNGLGFTWSQHLENTAGGNPVHVRFAVQTTGGSWYASNGVFDTGTVGAGSQGNFDPQTLSYNPAKANWLNLTIGAAPVDGVTIGEQPASNLSGNITGIGFVASFVSNANSTVHIDFVDVGIPPVPGDVNGDRIVDLNIDYAAIKSHFGTNVASRALGDVTGDGVVNLLDFAQWKGNYPFPGSGSGGNGGGTVPEPASAVLIALSLPLGWGMLRLRRKNSARRFG